MPQVRSPLRAFSLALSASLALTSAAPAQSNAPNETKPPIPDDVRELVRRYGNARATRMFDVSTDGAQALVGTRFGETCQLHLVASPLGVRSQLTFGPDPIESARFLPQDPNRILYLQDHFGNQNYQIYEFDKSRAQATQLTDGKSRQGDLVLARDGRRLAWSGNARAGSESDVYVAEATSPGSPKLLTGLPGRWRPLDFSPNDHTLLVLHERSPGDAELFAIAVESGEKKKLWPQEGTASVRFASYSADGHDLFVVTDHFSDAQELIRLDPDHPKKAPKRLSQELKWDVDALAAAPDRGAPAAAAIAVNQGGYDRLYLLEPGTLKLMPVSLPPGVVTAMRFPTVKSDLLYLGLTSPERPEDLYQLDVRTRRLTQWTRAELGPIDASSLLHPQSTSWLSDGLTLPAIVYRPRNEAAAKLPVAIALGRAHSHPARFRPAFDATAQLLANELGIAVVEPALRGSANLGHQILGDPDPAKLLQQQLTDLAATLDWIAAQPELDATQVVLIFADQTLAHAAESNFANRIRAALGADDRTLDKSKSAQDAALADLLVTLHAKLLDHPKEPTASPHATTSSTPVP